MDYEENYKKVNALKGLKNNIALFGRSMFPSALRKSIPPFHGEVYKALADDEEKRVFRHWIKDIMEKTIWEIGTDE